MANRFEKDPTFREEQVLLGWAAEKIALVNAIALLPPLENTGRSREGHDVTAGYYQRCQADSTPEDDEYRFNIPSHCVTNGRRKAEPRAERPEQGSRFEQDPPAPPRARATPKPKAKVR